MGFVDPMPEPPITDAQWTGGVEWWGSMSRVLRVLSKSTRQSAEGQFSWSGSMLFEVDGVRLTWTLRRPEVKSTTLDRTSRLQI